MSNESGRSIWMIPGVVVIVALVGGSLYWAMTRAQVEPPPLDAGPAPLPTVPDGPPWFRDVTADSGLDFSYRNGQEADQFTILESMGGGVALIDFDGDGLLDVFVTGGGHFDGPDKQQIRGHPCKLFKNLGNCKLRDVSADAGLDQVAWWYTHGVAVADYDCDGWPDLLVTGYGRVALLRNVEADKGRRRFVDVTDKVGLKDDSWSTSAGWADLDGDGFPDLYVCHYLDWSFENHPSCPGYIPGVARDICSPARFKPLVHALFRNDKGTFRNVSAEHGFRAQGNGLGVVLADLNGDGRPDLYVANDTQDNFLYWNRDGKLEDGALAAGVAMGEDGHRNGSMGVDVGDFDGSGRPSLFVTVFQYETHALYRNLGREAFHHQSHAAGIAALSRHLVGFGAGFLDIDNDGWEDLVFVNGHVFRQPAGSSGAKQNPVCLYNSAHKGQRFFIDAGARAGPFFQTPALARGLAIGDLDNDGWPDLVVSRINSPVAILRNVAGAASKNRWLGVKLAANKQRDLAGSTVILETTSRKLTRFVKGGGSYLCAGDLRILFGLDGAEAPRKLTVRWSWGAAQSWENLEVNRYVVITEKR